jgi:hypothetical protein
MRERPSSSGRVEGDSDEREMGAAEAKGMEGDRFLGMDAKYNSEARSEPDSPYYEDEARTRNLSADLSGMMVAESKAVSVVKSEARGAGAARPKPSLSRINSDYNSDQDLLALERVKKLAMRDSISGATSPTRGGEAKDSGTLDSPKLMSNANSEYKDVDTSLRARRHFVGASIDTPGNELNLDGDPRSSDLPRASDGASDGASGSASRPTVKVDRSGSRSGTDLQFPPIEPKTPNMTHAKKLINSTFEPNSPVRKERERTSSSMTQSEQALMNKKFPK